MPDLKSEYVLAFVALVLPGAISMYVYGFLAPQKEGRLQERVLEAIRFSLLNMILIFPALHFLIGIDGIAVRPILQIWAIAFLALVVAPVIWPFLLVRLLEYAERKKWIGVRAKTAWDHFFNSSSRGCWVAVELTDGKVVGGRFDVRSFASAFPEPGHIYIEELWMMDAEGRFTESVDGKPGIILRPGDYRHIKVYGSA